MKQTEEADADTDMSIQQTNNTNKKKKNKKKQKKPDAYLNRRIKWTEKSGKVLFGTVDSITQLKGKGGKLYLIKWEKKSGGGENRLTRRQVRDHLVP